LRCSQAEAMAKLAGDVFRSLRTNHCGLIGKRSFAAAVLKPTLIQKEHIEDGGKLVDFAGYGMPVQYKNKGSPHDLSIIQSTKWTRESASLFDVSHMCSVKWTGKNALDFVERVTTADVYGLDPMQGTLSVILNKDGGVIDDTMVTKCVSDQDGEYVYQVINAGCADKDIAHFQSQLDMYDGDVNMEIQWDNRGLYALQGPKAVDVMQRLSPATDFQKFAFGQSAWMDLGGANCFVSRCGYTGEDGFEIFVPEADAVGLWRSLRGADEVRLAGLGARDALRLEAGLCLYGHDMDENTTPIDAGLTWVVGKARRELDAKNPFIGKERIMAQINDRKNLVPSLRAGLVSTGPPAREGAVIETLDGEKVGVVTSGTMSPCLKKNISMGNILKPFNKRDTELQVVVRGKKYPATVTKMPFVPTKYYKP